MEPPFDKLDGVLATTSGYTGGSKVDPTYEEVSAGGTGHTEAVQITYDPAQGELRSAARGVLAQRRSARCRRPVLRSRRPVSHRRSSSTTRSSGASPRQSKQALVDSKRFEQPIVTEIVTAGAVLSGRGLPPGLLREESAPVQVLPLELRPRPAPRARSGASRRPTDHSAERGPEAGLSPARLGRGRLQRRDISMAETQRRQSSAHG